MKEQMDRSKEQRRRSLVYLRTMELEQRGETQMMPVSDHSFVLKYISLLVRRNTYQSWPILHGNQPLYKEIEQAKLHGTLNLMVNVTSETEGQSLFTIWESIPQTARSWHENTHGGVTFQGAYNNVVLRTQANWYGEAYPPAGREVQTPIQHTIRPTLHLEVCAVGTKERSGRVVRVRERSRTSQAGLFWTETAIEYYGEWNRIEVTVLTKIVDEDAWYEIMRMRTCNEARMLIGEEGWYTVKPGAALVR